MRIEDVRAIAEELHEGQLDKSGAPYIGHLDRVRMYVCALGGNANQEAAALLHDSIEDGLVTADDLAMKYGVPDEVIAIVQALTTPKGANYFDYVRSLKSNKEAVLVKRADIANNSDPKRLVRLDPLVAEKLRSKYSQALEILMLD